MSFLIIRYSEIALKGKNRHWFEKILVENIKKKLKEKISVDFTIERISGRIFLSITSLKNEEKEKINQILQNIFGITNFSWVEKASLDIENISYQCWKLIKRKRFNTFRITTQRSNKKFFLTSEKINQQVGAFIFQKIIEKGKKPQVRLKNPDLECFIEINDKNSFVYLQKIKGIKGLPVGSSGKALALLSGGIDSPVASYYALKRGVHTDYIHFHALPYTKPDSIQKVIQLAKILSKLQNQNKLFLFPLGKIQKYIAENSPEKFRLLLYRRLMHRITSQIAREKKYLALYTGESVGQVASQTLENLAVTNQASDLIMLRPLIGMDKEEIIKIAQKIGTYEISILPHEDLCSRFVPKHPATKAHLKTIQNIENKLNLQDLIQESLDKVEIKTFN